MGGGGGLKFLDTRTAPEQLMTKSLNKFSQEGVENAAFIERRLLKTFTEKDVYYFYRFRYINRILCFDIVYIVNFSNPNNTFLGIEKNNTLYIFFFNEIYIWYLIIYLIFKFTF